MAPTGDLLPLVLTEVRRGLPPLTGVPSPLSWVPLVAAEGLGTVPKVASSLHLTEGTAAEPCVGEPVLQVLGAVAVDEDVELDNFKATASWRACASQQKQGVTSL